MSGPDLGVYDLQGPLEHLGGARDLQAAGMGQAEEGEEVRGRARPGSIVQLSEGVIEHLVHLRDGFRHRCVHQVITGEGDPTSWNKKKRKFST